MHVTLSLLSFNLFQKLWLMGEKSIEHSETSVETSSSGIPGAEHVTISCKSASLLCVWCFDGSINSSH